MPILPSGLSPLELSFVNAYLKSNFNGSKAYQAIKPDVTPDSARWQASQIIARPHVAIYLEEEIARRDKSTQLTDRNYLASRTIAMVDAAEAKKEYSTAIKGIDVIGKLHRLYDRDAPDMDGYSAILNQLNVVQVNVSTPGPASLHIDNMGDIGNMELDNNAQTIDIVNDYKE